MSRCEICQENESKWPCLRCGKWVCERCITDELCLVCYADTVSEEQLGFSVEPKLPVTKQLGINNKLAAVMGFMFPWCAVLVGLIYAVIIRDEYRRASGRLLLKWGLIGAAIWTCGYLVVRFR